MSGNVNRFLKFEYLLPPLFFAAAFLFLLQPVGAEQDFWWHLSTGKWIWEHGTLPDYDPFSLFATHRPAGSELLVLKGYWLSQSIYYLLYLAGGLTAVCILGTAAMVATIFLVWRILLLRNIPDTISLIALAPAVAAMGFFSEHRPQQFSFLFFALLLYLLELIVSNLEQKGHMGVPAYLVPLLILLWAQMHPGYAVAFPLLVIYLVAARTIRKRHPSGRNTPLSRPFFGFLLLVVASMAATLAAPNGPAALVDIFGSIYKLFLDSRTDALVFTTIDHHSPWEVADVFGVWYWRLLLSSLIVALISCLACFRSLPGRCTASVVVYALLSLVAFRFGMFFFISGATVTGYFLLLLIRKVQSRYASVACSVATFFLILSFLLSGARHGLIARGSFTQSLVSDRAVSFLLASNIPGAVANPYSWGGYLMWRIWPHYRIFSDQRGLEALRGSARYDDVMFMDDTSILDRLNINAVVMNYVDPLNASVYYGFITLMESGTWDLVYYDDISAIFARSGPGLLLPALKKSALEQEMTATLLQWMKNSPDDAVPCLLLGQVAFWRGNFPEAARYFNTAAARNPGDGRARSWLDALKSAGGGRNR